MVRTIFVADNTLKAMFVYSVKLETVASKTISETGRVLSFWTWWDLSAHGQISSWMDFHFLICKLAVTILVLASSRVVWKSQGILSAIQKWVKIHTNLTMLVLDVLRIVMSNMNGIVSICCSKTFCTLFYLILSGRWYNYPYFTGCMLSCLSCVWLFTTLWTVAHQAPLSMGFSRQEYWTGLPCPPPEDLPNPGVLQVSKVRKIKELA